MKFYDVENLQKLSQVDIRDVDIADLIDISDVKIDSSLKMRERVMAYIEQVKNPYCFLSHGVKVKISFAGSEDLSDCLEKGIHFGAEESARAFGSNPEHVA